MQPKKKEFEQLQYEKLREHIGHHVEVVAYGDEGRDPENIAVECLNCSTVLTDVNLVS